MMHARSEFFTRINMLKLLSRATFLATILVSAASANNLQLEAYYPYATDLADATGNYGDTVLNGPTAPSEGVPLCHDSTYSNPPSVRTANISGLDLNDFQLDIEFRLTALPTNGFGNPVIMGSSSYRFIGIYVDPEGKVGLVYNNSNYDWSSKTVTADTWYAAKLVYSLGHTQLYLDGELILESDLPELIYDVAQFTTTDGSRGYVLNGCIRNLALSNRVASPVPLSNTAMILLTTLLLGLGLFATRRRFVN